VRATIKRTAAGGAVLGLALTAGTAAWAAAAGSVTAEQSVGVTSWGATPRAWSSDAAPTLDWSVVDQFLNPDKYFRVVNTGSATLTGMTWTFTVTRTSGTGALREIRFSACPVPWNTSAGTCSGGQGTVIGTTASNTVGTSTLTVTSTVVPAAPGAVLYMKAIPTQFGLTNFAATVSTAVNSATQIASAPVTVTNS
jgi:hypothetical protein